MSVICGPPCWQHGLCRFFRVDTAAGEGRSPSLQASPGTSTGLRGHLELSSLPPSFLWQNQIIYVSQVFVFPKILVQAAL